MGNDMRLKQEEDSSGVVLQRRKALLVLAAAVLAVAGRSSAHGQAVPTATAGVQFSTFGGVTGAYTGVGLGRNLSITAGVDATFRPLFLGLYPSAEVRGTYPVDRGSVDGQKNVLGGLVLARHLGRLQPYGDILVGRGEVDYNPPRANPTGTALYVQTGSLVISPGAGCNVQLNEHFDFKGDFQLQRYSTPVEASGSTYAKDFTLGIVYRLPFGGLGHGRR